jgi:hypothetical protein
MHTTLLLVLHLLHLRSTAALEFGVNVHNGGANPQRLAEILSQRNLKHARFDLWGNDPKSLATFRTAVGALNAAGIRSEAVVFTVFSRDQKRSEDCGADLREVEATAYNQTKPQIEATKDLLQDFELQNEVNLYPNMKAPNTTGQNASDYEVLCGHMQAAVLRGMSRAVADVRRDSGLPLRIIVGTTDRSFGFIRFMQSQNVSIDVLGYHIYPWFQNKPLDQDPFFGPGGCLGQLGMFKLPIRINEYNAGEIYAGTGAYSSYQPYENTAGQKVTEQGFQSMHKHLEEIVLNTVANVESIMFYEIWDETRKKAPENRFGLFYDANMTLPKISLFVASCYAGGFLSPTERELLVKRQLGHCSRVPA